MRYSPRRTRNWGKALSRASWTPVEARLPVVDHAAEPGGVHALGPPHPGDRLRPAGAGQPLAEIGQDDVRDVGPEGLDVRSRHGGGGGYQTGLRMLDDRPALWTRGSSADRTGRPPSPRRAPRAETARTWWRQLLGRVCPCRFPCRRARRAVRCTTARDRRVSRSSTVDRAAAGVLRPGVPGSSAFLAHDDPTSSGLPRPGRNAAKGFRIITGERTEQLRQACARAGSSRLPHGAAPR